MAEHGWRGLHFCSSPSNARRPATRPSPARLGRRARARWGPMAGIGLGRSKTRGPLHAGNARRP
eukprot:325153-Lingulodinium_polyedra.AAC.1